MTSPLPRHLTIPGWLPRVRPPFLFSLRGLFFRCVVVFAMCSVCVSRPFTQAGYTLKELGGWSFLPPGGERFIFCCCGWGFFVNQNGVFFHPTLVPFPPPPQVFLFGKTPPPHNPFTYQSFSSINELIFFFMCVCFGALINRGVHAFREPRPFHLSHLLLGVGAVFFFGFYDFFVPCFSHPTRDPPRVYPFFFFPCLFFFCVGWGGGLADVFSALGGALAG